jgi:hypothetical protein
MLTSSSLLMVLIRFGSEISLQLKKYNGSNNITLKLVNFNLIKVITAAEGVTLKYDKSILHIHYKLQDTKH